MYPAVHAKIRANQPAFIMAQTGVAVTYAELEQRTNRLAHFLRSRGLKRLDHYAIFMENNDRYVESCGAGERAGLYFTCVNSFLTAGELALHRQQQRIQSPNCIRRDSRDRPRRNRPVPKGRSRAGGGRP